MRVVQSWEVKYVAIFVQVRKYHINKKYYHILNKYYHFYNQHNNLFYTLLVGGA